jgi:BirA family biotin operon repressor/biotin-[acetyl-CoA-carboxylase] ligase
MAVSIPGGVAPPPLLVLLSDGEVRSGESLAEHLGQTRAAVWKGVQRLRALGIGVQALARRGYRLSEPVELLRADLILPELSAQSRRHLRNLEISVRGGFDQHAAAGGQTAADRPGRRMHERAAARRPRPLGKALDCAVRVRSGDFRGLVVQRCRAGSAGIEPRGGRGGVACLGAGRRTGIALKWPNDVWYRDRKVGGVLVEIRAEAGGPAQVVIGIGLNVRLPAAARQEIETSGAQVAAVADACKAPPSRNQIAGTILDELLSMLVQFERVGFPAFRDDWTALDALNGRHVQVQLGDKIATGTARGADLDGALLLETEGGLRRFVSGEASLRLIEGDN